MKINNLILAAVFFTALAAPVLAEGTMVGGHVKLTLFDYAYGIHSDAGGVEYGSQSTGFGFLAFVVYISQTLNENISAEIQPLFTAVTGATPSIGSGLGEQMSSAGGVTLKFSGVDWGKAVVKLSFPDQGIDISAGIVKPKFTMEYGGELFWDDELSGGRFAINDYVGRMQSAGIEIFKNFDIGGISIPAYFYIINGTTQFMDNNSQPSGMIHLEPDLGFMKLSGSFFAGKYNDSENLYNMRWSGGFSFSTDNLSLRAEYAGGRWEKGIEGAADATPAGLYCKVFYNVAPWLKLMYHFDLVYHNFQGFNSFSSGTGEIYITHTPGIVLTVFDSLLQFRIDIADWKRIDNSESIVFTRPVLGWRFTF